MLRCADLILICNFLQEKKYVGVSFFLLNSEKDKKVLLETFRNVVKRVTKSICHCSGELSKMKRQSFLLKYFQIATLKWF